MKKLSVIILAAMSMFTATASAQLKWGISGGLNVNKQGSDRQRMLL